MSLKLFIKSLDNGEVLIPELRRFFIERTKLEETGKLSRKDVTVQDAKQVIACYTERIEEFNHGEEIKGEFFHPSALGQCQRKIFFDIKNAPRDTAVASQGDDLIRSHMTFETGTHIHVIVQNICESAGLLVKREVAIQDEKRKILGHCDSVLKIRGVKYALEIKSINSAGFQRTTAPKHEHKAQLHAYMRCLGLKWGIVLYVNKDTGQMKEYVVRFDLAFYMEHVRGRIRTFFKRLRKNTLPPREGTSPSVFPCMFCPFTRICFETGYVERWMKTMTPEQKAKTY